MVGSGWDSDCSRELANVLDWEPSGVVAAGDGDTDSSDELVSRGIGASSKI